MNTSAPKIAEWVSAFRNASKDDRRLMGMDMSSALDEGIKAFSQLLTDLDACEDMIVFILSAAKWDKRADFIDQLLPIAQLRLARPDDASRTDAENAQYAESSRKTIECVERAVARLKAPVPIEGAPEAAICDEFTMTQAEPGLTCSAVDDAALAADNERAARENPDGPRDLSGLTKCGKPAVVTTKQTYKNAEPVVRHLCDGCQPLDGHQGHV